MTMGPEDPIRPDAPPGEPPAPRRPLVVRVLLDVLVVPFVIFDEIVRPLFAPLIRALQALALVQRMERAVAALPRYAILAVFVVPFLIAEPLKILGLYWLGTGHVRVAIPTLILAHGATFLIVERIFDAGRDKLMTIGWFARIITVVFRVRDAALAWVRSSRAWKTVREYGRRLRLRVREIAARWKSA
ncbi:hypothetical protein ABEG18_11860 [Alsobacter sp. KACC 23698]|uniref:Uncharacterized protein n=1 Tax=Alsobacter sp. KACC 23698 TaxID=3149229 RepID=A0AAU7JMA2_9HYPH